MSEATELGKTIIHAINVIGTLNDIASASRESYIDGTNMYHLDNNLKSHVGDFKKSIKKLETVSKQNRVKNNNPLLNSSQRLQQNIQQLLTEIEQIPTTIKKTYTDYSATDYSIILTDIKQILQKDTIIKENIDKYNIFIQYYKKIRGTNVLVKECDNLIKEFNDKFIINALIKPISQHTFQPITPTPNNYDHIPCVNKIQSPLITIKPVKWNEWCDFEMDNGDMADIMGRQMGQFTQIMGEQEKIRYGRTIINNYRKYADNCKSQGVKPDPIPNIDILNRRCESITLTDGEIIYNTNYNPPSCIII